MYLSFMFNFVELGLEREHSLEHGTKCDGPKVGAGPKVGHCQKWDNVRK